MKLSKITNMTPDIRTYAPSDELVMGRGIVGIEIDAEAVNVSKFKNLKLWRIINDPSLRNNGREFITKPIFGQDVINALDEFEKCCAKADNYVEFTWRTSTHVHVDVREMDMESLQRFLELYIITEPHLFSYCSPERYRSIYCLPVSAAEYAIPLWGKILNYAEAGEERMVKDSLMSLVKYQALNLLPILRQGSIEFRHLQGTPSKAVILPWINMLLSMQKIAIEKPKEDWIALSSTKGIEWILNAVYGPELAAKFAPIHPDKVFQAVRLAQDVTRYGDLANLQRYLTAKYDVQNGGRSGYDKYRNIPKTELKPPPANPKGKTKAPKLDLNPLKRFRF